MGNATKWSTLSEVIAKLIVPITNIVLARMLAPEIFGVVASITMITSFADMLTDAGFQKYIIQHQFNTKKELYENANVAFVTNLLMSCFIWVLIALFNSEIAKKLGNDGYGMALCIASLQLPITALSSIQMAIYKKNLNFKTLFLRRIVSIVLPFFITIPLAFLGFEHWALIIGTLLGNVANVIILTIYSKWKPRLFFEYSILKKMFSFSSWSLVESLTVWLSANIDTLIIGTMMTQYYLGLYKNSINMVNSMMAIITMSFTPVLISGISKLQNDEEKYNKMFYDAQRLISWIVFPLGVGLFLNRNLAVSILFGKGWIEAADIIGIFALVIPFKISISSLVSVCYISKGKPNISALSQMLYIIPLIPISIISLKSGFWTFVLVRNLFVFELIFVNLVLIKYVANISAIKMCKNILKPLFCTIVMSIVDLLISNISTSIIFQFVLIFVCMLIYFVTMRVVAKNEFNYMITMTKRRILKSNYSMKDSFKFIGYRRRKRDKKLIEKNNDAKA
jgi:PST family polysaccharide transporter